MRRSRDPLWTVPAAALALRMTLFVFAAPHPERFMTSGDAREYFTLAHNLVSGHGFSLSERDPYQPDVRRTPVYPSALAAVFATGAGSVRLAALVGLAASVASVVALIQLTGRLFAAAEGRVAGLLLAIDVTSATYSTQLLTEALFTLLLLLALLAATDARSRESASAVAAGVLAGVAALCRPIGLFLAAALLPACVWRARGSGRRAAVLLLVAVVASALPIALWALRNARASGVATFTSQAATNAYFHRAAYVAAELEGRRVEDVREEWEREFTAASAGWSEAERVRWMNDHGRSAVLAHPLTYAIVFAKGIGRMLAPDRDVLPVVLGVGRDSAAWRSLYAVAWVQLLIVYALASYGAWCSIRRSGAAAWVPLAVIAYFVLLAGPEVYSRFRVPFMPAVCMLAAVGFVAVRGRSQRT